MPDKSYPEGVTSMDHIRHDMKMGRFPNQSSVETFMEERATLLAQEGVAHLPNGASLHNEMVEAIKDLINALPADLDQSQLRTLIEAEKLLARAEGRSVPAKVTGSKTDPS